MSISKRIKEGTLLTCPYENCNKVGVADKDFKRIVGRSLFTCPKCGKTFAAYVDNKGKIRYLKQR